MALATSVGRTWMDSRIGRVAITAGAGVAQRLVAVIGTAVIFPLTLQALGATRFGILGAAMSLTMIVTVADFGLGPTVVTLLARAFGQSDNQRAQADFTAALISGLLVALAVVLAGTALVIGFAPRPAVNAYLIAVVGIALNVPLGLASAAWMALQRGYMAALADTVQIMMLLVGVIVAVHLTDNLLVYVSVVYGSLLLSNFFNFILLIVTRSELRPRMAAKGSTGFKLVMRTGGKYFMFAGLDSLSYMFDTVIVLQLLGEAASGKMAIVQRVCAAALGFILVTCQPLWPAFVDAATRGERRWIVITLLRSMAFVLVIAVLGSAILIAFGQPLLRLWLGHSFSIEPSLLWTMGFWIVALSIVRVPMLLLNALQIVDFQIAVMALATVIGFTLKLVLAPILGVQGVLLATAATMPVVVFPALAWRLIVWFRKSRDQSGVRA